MSLLFFVRVSRFDDGVGDVGVPGAAVARVAALAEKHGALCRRGAT